MNNRSAWYETVGANDATKASNAAGKERCDDKSTQWAKVTEWRGRRAKVLIVWANPDEWDVCETTEIYGWKKTRETDIETEDRETEKRRAHDHKLLRVSAKILDW
jgi:Icc-related predicted phosphoesterase